uniref:helix-turn-helix domain-containing protein n=1 Tax=Streptomyces winkii TaxID=3051178 RepID=UPI0028D75708|nr:helix-turn-helix domain-containing protein [Streptomyces sp. DSM 40971]
MNATSVGDEPLPSLPVAGVAARCGFGSAETLRQAFTARYGVSPSHYRVTQSGNPAARGGR